MKQTKRCPIDRCLRCDGMGEICRICGESPRSCTCEHSPDETLDECPDCNGTGM